MDKQSLQHWISKNERLVPKLEAMRADRHFKKGNTLYVLVLMYRDQAIIEWLLGHPTESRQAFSKAANSYVELLELFGEKEVYVRPGFLSHVFYLPIVCSVLAGDEDLKRDLVRKAVSNLCEVESIYFTNFYFSLAFLSVGDCEKAISHAKSALSAETVWSEGLLKLVISIASNDQKGVSAAWGQAYSDFLADIESELDDMPESALFLDGIALLRLNFLHNGVKFMPKNGQIVPVSLMYGAVSA